MAGVGIREYARQRKAAGLSGGSDAAVRKAITDGRLDGAVTGSGRDTLIDPVKANAIWAGSTNPTFQRDAAAVGEGVRASKAKPAPVKAPPAVKPADEPEEVEPVAGPVPMTGARAKIQAARELQKMKREAWEFERDRGEWLPKRLFLMHVGELTQSYQDQWRGWVDGNAAEMAAELDYEDVGRFYRVLDDRVRMMFERMAETRLKGGAS